MNCDVKTADYIAHCSENVLRRLLVDSRRLRHTDILGECIDRGRRHIDDFDRLRN